MHVSNGPKLDIQARYQEMMGAASVILAFLLGTCCGALLIAIERHARIQQLQMAFQTNLQSICDRFENGWDSESGIRITEEQNEIPAASHSAEAPVCVGLRT